MNEEAMKSLNHLNLEEQRYKRSYTLKIKIILRKILKAECSKILDKNLKKTKTLSCAGTPLY